MGRKFLTIFFLAVFSISSVIAVHAKGLWEEIAHEKGLDPYELYAIALVESRRIWTDGQVRPWPYTLMINGKKNTSVFMPDRESANTLLTLLLENGVNNVDVCCMQINLAIHMDRIEDPSQLFDLNTCVGIGADILKVAMNSTTDKELALGRYHHWKHEHITRDYGRKIIVLANSLRETGLFEE